MYYCVYYSMYHCADARPAVLRIMDQVKRRAAKPMEQVQSLDLSGV
jgi:hypothetical protein